MTALPSPLTAKPARRADIDGLRALAVVAVLVFHGFPELLPAGFLGVDIFFVISGCVITQSLLHEADAGGIRLADFYARRIRRLFPALALVMAATLALGWFVLLPDEYGQTAALALSASFSAANLRLLHEAGYFDVATAAKPLMHLWSLGVEEQFYLAWPLALPALARSRAPLAWLAAAAAASLGLQVHWSAGAADDAFYNPVARAWELLAGAALAWRSRTGHGMPLRAGFWPGLALILAAFTPALAGTGIGRNLLAVAGAALVIASGRGPAEAAPLSWRPLQWLGRISYPLYLWHWPMLALRNLLGGGEATAPWFTACWLGISLLLADRTHAWLERPVAARPGPRMAFACTLALALPAGFAALLLAQDGAPYRAVAERNAHIATTKLRAGKAEYTVADCVVAHAPVGSHWCARDAARAPDSVVWGDSKGDALYWGLLRETRAQGYAWMLIGSSGCPASDADYGGPQCDRGRALPLQAIADPRVRRVVVVAAARTMAAPAARSNFESALRAVAALGKSVVVVVDNPTVIAEHDKAAACGREVAVPWLAGIAQRRRCEIRYSDHLAATADYRRWIEQATAAVPGAVLHDPAPVLCDIPHDRCPAVRDGKYLYSYGDHISDAGNERIARAMLQAGVIAPARPGGLFP